MAESALAVLARLGERTDIGSSGDAVWQYRSSTPEGKTFEIRCSGPDLPATVPDETVLPADIPKDPKWRGIYRLVVVPPLVTLDIAWRPESPLRILTFSRGDWEKYLIQGRVSV